MSLITSRQVVLYLTGADRNAATRTLAEALVDTGRCTDLEQFLTDVRTREETMATGLPGGIGIPHARSAAITEPSLVFGRSADGIDWGAEDGPAKLIFLIAAPAGGGDAHMQMLPKLARALMKTDFRAALMAATDPNEVVDLVNAEVSVTDRAKVATSTDAPVGATGATGAAAASAAATGAAATGAAATGVAATAAAATGVTDAPARMTFVGVTSCPTGIAHTYMAAEALENAAKAAGHVMKVETQGSAGSSPLSAAEIAAADAVVFAHDLPVKDIARFAGKPVIDVGVKKAISGGPALIAEAVRAAGAHKANPGSVATVAAGAGGGGLVSKVDNDASTGTKIRQWLMTGVSYMIPFVAAGGILIALSFMLAQVAIGENGAIEIVKYGLGAEGQYNLTENFNPISLTSWAALLFIVGAAAFGFLVPILSGFIAFAIADRPGLVPGIVGGAIASAMSAGFLGGLATGVLAGLVARWISGWKVHKGVRGVMPVVVTPLLSTLITAGLFITVLGRPIKWLMDNLTDALNSMSGTSALVLGLVLGAMMGFDLGGPVNKVAYGFATAGLAGAGTVADAPQLKIMAAVMAAGMVAPLAMALATTVRPALFTEPERENGKAAWLLGASFISAMAFGTTLRAPHGGIWVLPLIGNFLMFLVALLAGVLVMTGIVVVLKQRDHSRIAATATV